MAMTHGSHVGGLTHAHMSGQMPKIMSVPDFAMPFQQSGFQQPSQFGRRSGEEVETPWGRGHSHQQPPHLHQQLGYQQLQPDSVSHMLSGRTFA